MEQRDEATQALQMDTDTPAAHTTNDDATGDAAEAAEAAKSPSPITNAILSQAVTTAISQLDTKRAFDMMLLNEQMSALEAETKCAKEEAAFLRQSLAKQTQETSEMYHYFHGKMDTHVATIARLETDLATALADIVRLKDDHEVEQAEARKESEQQMTKANEEVSRLREELQQLNAFSTQKKQMEALISELRDELAAKAAQFTSEKNALELKAMFEKDRVKKEMLTHMKETKEALLLRTEDQLNTTTKRTMMENDHFMEELSFQSKETEKLLMRFRTVEEEVQRLRVENKVLEENQSAMAKKTNYYQKIVAQLKKQPEVTKAIEQSLDSSAEQATALLETEQRESQAKTVEIQRLQTKLQSMEDAVRVAQQWVHACQQEKQFVIAQQDEIIQFLCRALSDVSVGHPSTELAVGPADQLTTMEELVTALPPIALDELSSQDTRQVLQFLLEKMRVYQQQVAAIYRGRVASPHRQGTSTGRDMLSKQLGVELPPITVASPSNLTSPLKVKRRIQPYSPHASAGNSTAATRPPPPINAPTSTGKAGSSSSMASPNPLLVMATTSFNFTPSLSPIKSPVKKASPLKPVGGKKPRSERSDSAAAELEASERTLAATEALPSAWSTDSLPVYDEATEPQSKTGGEHSRKQASASKRGHS